MSMLARLVVKVPWLVLLLWIVAIGVVIQLTPDGPEDNTPPPHPTNAQVARQILADYFGAAGIGSGSQQDVLSNHPPVNVVLTTLRNVPGVDLKAMRSLSTWLLMTGFVDHVNGPITGADKHAAMLTVVYSDPGLCYDCDSAIASHLDSLQLSPGATIGLTGQGAVARAQDDAFSSLTTDGLTPTLLASLILVLLILSAVYRSPLAVLVPMIGIGTAVFTSLRVVKILAHAGWVPHDTITNEFVSVVLFGAGTNYCLFLLSRYRENIRLGLSPREATIVAITRVGEAISSSAGTVIAAMAVLGFTQSPLFRAIGPSVAVAVAIMLTAGLTLVPALMRLCGRALLWPSTPRPIASTSDASVLPATFWGIVGRLVVTYPTRMLIACLLVLGPLAALAITIVPSYDNLRTLPTSNSAVRAAVAIQDHFGSSTEQETLVLLDSTNRLNDRARQQALLIHLWPIAQFPGVKHVSMPLIAPDGSAAAVPLTLAVETSSPAAHDLISRIDASLNSALQDPALVGVRALLGGDSASTHDESVQVGQDFSLILWSVTIIIYLILALLVRSISAPIYLLLSIALSAASSVGLTILMFHIVLGQLIYYTTPVFAFVFLVALGEDFNILLMSRIREEIKSLGLRQGVARAVGSTGGTLSSCGLIMAGTFSVLISLPITIMQQIGFAVATGVLMDTFLIRPLLVPAIVCLLGRWNWVTVRGLRTTHESDDRRAAIDDNNLAGDIVGGS